MKTLLVLLAVASLVLNGNPELDKHDVKIKSCSYWEQGVPNSAIDSSGYTIYLEDGSKLEFVKDLEHTDTFINVDTGETYTEEEILILYSVY